MSKKIEDQVNKSFTNATPDVSKSVIADCQGTTVYRTQPATKRSNGTFWKFATLALALVLVITGVVGGIELGQTAQAAVVALDVNPSIELKIDGKNRIISATANNADAEIILQGMNLKGSTLDTAVYAIIGSMTVHGYLNEYTNSVLVSVDTKTQSLYDEIVDMVTSKIAVTLREHNIESSVVAQWLKNKEDAATIAREHNVSLGKAQLIAKIVEASSKDTTEGATVYTVKDLVTRTVNELSLILSKYQSNDGAINTNGSASEKAYVGKEKALSIALEYAGITFDPSMDTGVDLHDRVGFDIEKGVMVYEVEFVYGDYKYEVDVKAVDGEVIKFEKELRNVNEDATLPDLSDAELISKATEGIEGATNAQIADRERNHVEISFQTETHLYEVEITKKGIIISVEMQSKVQGSGDILSIEKIKEIALGALSNQFSFLDEQIEEFDCELSDDGLYYEVEIKVLGIEFEFYIDATTGELVRFSGFGHGNGNGYHGGRN